MAIYTHFHNMMANAPLAEREIQLCVGGEWYRFSSHYFLPDGVKLGFLKSEFTGLLPKYFQESLIQNATLSLKEGDIRGYKNFLRHGRRNTDVHVLGMNGFNREELDRYVRFQQR